MKLDIRLLALSIIIAIISIAMYVIVNENYFSITYEKPNSELPQSLSNSTEDDFRKQELTHCGTSEAKFNTYVKEYLIPTYCTQPLGIVSDSSNKIWFTETNNGNIGMFDPKTETFQEYTNHLWPKNITSMMWGIAYTDDNEIWFTEEKFDNLWKFSIDEKQFFNYSFPLNKKSAFPQKLIVDGKNFFINDFYGEQILIINHDSLDNFQMNFSSIQTTSDMYTGQPLLTNNNELWFMIWKYQDEAYLVKYLLNSSTFESYKLPDHIQAPNGLSADSDNNLWILDTGSSLFVKFDPEEKKFTTYFTTPPRKIVYGNSSGLIKTPITRPYWSTFEDGKLIFNEQTGNMIGVFYPKNETMIEYVIPSRNPNWADCGNLDDCGVAQIFGFHPNGNKIWFTEWVENKIGFVDTSIPLPGRIVYDTNTLSEQTHDRWNFLVEKNQSDSNFIAVISSENNEIKISNLKQTHVNEKTDEISFEISPDSDIMPGEYKLLLSVEFPYVTVSKFIDVTIN